MYGGRISGALGVLVLFNLGFEERKRTLKPVGCTAPSSHVGHAIDYTVPFERLQKLV